MGDALREALRRAVELAAAEAAAGRDPGEVPMGRAVSEHDDVTASPLARLIRALDRRRRETRDIPGVSFPSTYGKSIAINLRTPFKETSRSISWNPNTNQFRNGGSESPVYSPPLSALIAEIESEQLDDIFMDSFEDVLALAIAWIGKHSTDLKGHLE